MNKKSILEHKKRSKSAKNRWLRGDGSGFKKGNKLWDNSNAKKTQFKKGQVSWIKGKKNPKAKDNPQVFRKGNIPWTKGKKIWKGSKSEYSKLHYWVKINKKDKTKCKKCGSEKQLVWANISQEYLKILKDWQCLCRSCHLKDDLKFIKNKYGKQ